MEKPKPVKVDRVKEWEVEKILNKRKVRGVIKYLVYWKGITAENNTWEKEKDLKNTKELVNKFKEKIEAKVRHQERLEKVWKVKLNLNVEKFRRNELLGKYTTNIFLNKIMENSRTSI